MPFIRVTLDLEATPWEDLNDLREQGKFISAMGLEAGDIRIGALPGGMESGRPTITLAVPLPDGTIVLTETSMSLFFTAAHLLKAAYPEEWPQGLNP